MMEGRGEPVVEGGTVGVGAKFTLGIPTIRVEDSRVIMEVQCQPETASESAVADTTGNQGE